MAYAYAASNPLLMDATSTQQRRSCPLSLSPHFSPKDLHFSVLHSQQPSAHQQQLLRIRIEIQFKRTLMKDNTSIC